ncbi:carboxypeptidase regulatory-like domain-containing protein [Gemmatimonadota bacterium]
MRSLAALFILLLGAAWPTAASAQAVRGQLIDSENLAPIEGAMVWLVDSQGVQQVGYISNAAGRFLLRAPSPGEYHIRVERIGFTTVVSSPMMLEADQVVDYRMEMVQEVIALDELVVEGEQQCVVRPEEGLQSNLLWEEARKALTRADWTDDQRAYRYRILNYDRDLEAETLRVTGEERRYSGGVMRTPVQSLPGDDLAENGYIREAPGNSYDFFAPDANAFLSDPFLDTHCFHLVERSEGGEELIGLAFEPVRQRDIPDIAGTLWLDRGTAYLRHLEFRYTRIPWTIRDSRIGGQIDFEGLPNGSWIVRRWYIRMPVVAWDATPIMGEVRPRERLLAFKETGGEVVEISTLDRRSIIQSESGSISGSVWDSVQGGPLAGAEVLLSGTEHSTTTNAQGHFFLGGLPGGLFRATFTHPRVDSLGISMEGEDIWIAVGQHQIVYLALPTLRTVMADRCPPGEGEGEGIEEITGIVFGTVRDAGTGTALPGAIVVLDWSGWDLQYSGRVGERVAVVENTSGIQLEADSRGNYLHCLVPARTRVMVHAEFGGLEGDHIPVRLVPGAYVRVDPIVELRLPGGG